MKNLEFYNAFKGRNINSQDALFRAVANCCPLWLFNIMCSIYYGAVQRPKSLVLRDGRLELRES